MPALKIGIRLESLQAAFREALEIAARLGAKGVQFDAVGELSPDQLSQTGRREVKRLLRMHDLQLVAVGVPTRRGYDSRERLEARVAQTLKTLTFAHRMAAPFVVNHVGKIPSDPDSPENLHFFEAIDQIGREAERVGTRFAIETGLDEAAALAALLTRTRRFGLAVNYDPGNLFARGHDPYGAVQTLGEWIVGVHVKDVARTGSTLAGFVETPLGEGQIDWERILGELEGVDYRGFYTIEREGGENRVRDVAQAVELLSNW